jgi:hypothetical protein
MVSADGMVVLEEEEIEHYFHIRRDAPTSEHAAQSSSFTMQDGFFLRVCAEAANNPKADFVSVRGPHTAELLLQSGGPKVETFGDPGVVLSKILPLTRGATNGRVALIRHHTHLQAPVKLPDNFDELSVQVSHPNDIVEFIEMLLQYDYVVTSAMHVLITCQSYGIPCALVVFKGFEEYVHGDGIKYIDYALGADVKVISPTPINPKITWSEIEPLIETIKVSDLKISEVEMAIKEGLRRVTLTT